MISPRPQVADDWDGKVTEEAIMVFLLEHLLIGVKVQGSTAEGYFRLMKGWHSEVMGYQPAASGIYTIVWISKMLRGALLSFLAHGHGPKRACGDVYSLLCALHAVCAELFPP